MLPELPLEPELRLELPEPDEPLEP